MVFKVTSTMLFPSVGILVLELVYGSITDHFTIGMYNHYWHL